MRACKVTVTFVDYALRFAIPPRIRTDSSFLAEPNSSGPSRSVSHVLPLLVSLIGQRIKPMPVARRLITSDRHDISWNVTKDLGPMAHHHRSMICAWLVSLMKGGAWLVCLGTHRSMIWTLIIRLAASRSPSFAIVARFRWGCHDGKGYSRFFLI